MSTDYAYRTGLCRPLFFVDQNGLHKYTIELISTIACPHSSYDSEVLCVINV